MSELLLFYIVTLAAILAALGLLLTYRYFLGNRLVETSNKLKSQMAKLRQDFPELQQKKGEFVADALGDIGIEGIMKELGIDPGILKNPLVKGLVDKYMPRIMETIAKKAPQAGIEEAHLL